jgi:hypothetical protein
MRKNEAIRILEDRITVAAGRIRNNVPLKRVLNEWEVVFLLGAIAKEAGFYLFQGSDNYPDAILEVKTETETVQVRTELEYRASRFNHKPEGCDLIICWREDMGSTGVLPPIIALSRFFPELDAEKDDLPIDHEKMYPELKEAYFLIKDWLNDWKFIESGTGSKTVTNTVTFKRFTDNGSRSLCSLQYYNDAGFLQFKWFKDTIRAIGKSDLFSQCLADVRKLVLPLDIIDETEKEYRINIHRQYMPFVSDILKVFNALFEGKFN